MVGEVLHRPIRPDQGLSFNAGSVARPRDKGRTPSAAGNGTANQKDGNHQHSPAHDSLLFASGAADGPLQLNDACFRNGPTRLVPLDNVLPARVESNLAKRSTHE